MARVLPMVTSLRTVATWWCPAALGAARCHCVSGCRRKSCASRWARDCLLPETVIDAEPDDARLKARRGVDTARGSAAGRCTQIGIKIFDLRRPRSEDAIFEANTGGPPDPVRR